MHKQPSALLLAYQPPWDWQQFQAHHALRALAGVECVRQGSYARSVQLDGHSGWFSV
ncbi:MAG TPA: AlkA N-terminal domain-containing protein, partial [Pseudomonas sp.]|nr:AlkA N-terminal domain-containing protein [Pseudomonas sp.]